MESGAERSRKGCDACAGAGADKIQVTVHAKKAPVVTPENPTTPEVKPAVKPTTVKTAVATGVPKTRDTALFGINEFVMLSAAMTLIGAVVLKRRKMQR